MSKISLYSKLIYLGSNFFSPLLNWTPTTLPINDNILSEGNWLWHLEAKPPGQEQDGVKKRKRVPGAQSTHGPAYLSNICHLHLCFPPQIIPP